MLTLKRSLTAAALSVAVLASTSGLAQASGSHSIADVVDYVRVHDSAVIGHEALDIVNTVQGAKTIYSEKTYTLASIGPRDVSERASTAADYGVTQTR